MAIIGILVFAALIVFLGGAVIRAVAPMHSIDWAEEIALYCIIWATVISGSTLVAENRHISTEVFITRLTKTMQIRLGWLTTSLTIGFCAAMLFYGWQAYEFVLMIDERSASTLRMPQGYTVFLALPVGMALILARIAVKLFLGPHAFDQEGNAPSEKEH